jgi:murein DD-endopeptidase MepM/ murein hydrolase activator NlpD
MIRRRWAVAGVGGFALLGMVAAFALSPSGEDDGRVPLRAVLEQLATPTSTLSGSENGSFLREERILRSDTLASLATRLGIVDPEALAFIQKNASAAAIGRQMRPGKVVTAKTGERGELLALYFPLNGKDANLVVERSGDGFKASERALDLEPQTVVKSGEIRSSLFAATDAAGIPDAIASQLAEIFSGDIDFYRDLRKGDRFALVYEMFNDHGQPVRSGRILSAEFTNNQKVFSAYWFKADENGGYYSADGKNLRKAFLRSPLEFSRVTSGFSTARLHPVLNTIRAHKGVDYAAPIGTKVRSVADGTVQFVGWQGGFGKLIVLKHQGVYSTAYGHLSGFAAGLRPGSRVSQGETIGYTGQTGLATGPHLHYEFRVNSQQVNPLAVNLPAAIPLGAGQVGRFKAAIEQPKAQLALAKQAGSSALE